MPLYICANPPNVQRNPHVNSRLSVIIMSQHWLISCNKRKTEATGDTVGREEGQGTLCFLNNFSVNSKLIFFFLSLLIF